MVNGIVPSIRALLFDADGVVQHSNNNDLPVRLERILGFTPGNLDTFTREVFDVERPALAGQADFAEMLVPVVARWGAQHAAEKLAAEWWCSIQTDQAVLALIGRLRQRGFLCALATNQQRYRARYMDETLSYNTMFDRSFYSYQLGLVKPDLRYFKAIVAELALAPEDILFIDDAERNVAAAREAGLQAAQFVPTGSDHSVAVMIELLERFSVVVD